MTSDIRHLSLMTEQFSKKLLHTYWLTISLPLIQQHIRQKYLFCCFKCWLRNYGIWLLLFRLLSRCVINVVAFEGFVRVTKTRHLIWQMW